MTGTDLPDAMSRFDHAVSIVDTEGAVVQVELLLENGVEPVTVLADVIVAAQRKVGRRWQCAEWTVAQEHAATAVATAATEAVGRYVRRVQARPVPARPRPRRDRGELLGARRPPDHQALHRDQRHSRIPVLVGGSAFGCDPLRARALGATAWAPDVRGAVTALEGLPTVHAVAPLPALPSAELAGIERDRHRLISGVRAVVDHRRAPQRRDLGTRRTACRGG